MTTGIVNGVTNCYNYNAQNKLARIRGAGFTNELVYDSQNRRIALSQNGVTRRIMHDGNQPIAEAGSDNLICRTFVRGVGIAEGTGDMIAEIIGSDAGTAKAVFYLSNHRGDTLAVYCNISTLVAKYRYDAFGNQRTNYCVIADSTCAPRYTFSTKEYLPDAKLYMYAYRVYDPVAGRWTQRDPIDYQDSPNLYQFCGNNPVNILDVDGRIEFYGNWGGPDWTGGQTRPFESLTPGQQAVLRPPIDSMDDLFQTHDLAYSAARVTERNAIDAATKSRNEALKNAASPEQVGMANKQYHQAVRKAQSQCRTASNQADEALVDGLRMLTVVDPSQWRRPAPDPEHARSKRDQAIKVISAQRSLRAD